MTDIVLPLITIVLTLGGYFLGNKIRDITHAMIPLFGEPVSWTLIIVSLYPLMSWTYFPELCFIDPFDAWTMAIIAAFWAGYLIGYVSNTVDVIYVGVHQIVERTQSIEPIVRYTNKEGRSCWQPQGLKNIAKTLIFGIDNPLQLSGNIYRTRHVTMRNHIGIHLAADAVDVADLKVETYEVQKWKFKFTVESRSYVPSPNCTDSPYDWITRAMEYEDVFTEFNELQVQAAESKAALQVAQIKGGAAVLNALAGKAPSDVFMDQLGVNMEEIVNKRQKSRGMKNATKEVKNGAGRPEKAPAPVAEAPDA